MTTTHIPSPAWSKAMGYDSDPPPSTFYALKPLPHDNTTQRGYGITYYQIISDEKEILSNPDLPLFSTVEAAIKRLTSGSRPPAHCTRVFKFSDIPIDSRVHLKLPDTVGIRHVYRGHYSGDTSKILVVLDKPVIIDITHPKELLSTLRTFGSLPILTSDEKALDALLLNESRISRSSSSAMWGLPTIHLTQLTKSGKPKRRPTAAVAASRAAWLEAHLCFTKGFFSNINTFLSTSLLCKLPPEDHYSDKHFHWPDTSPRRFTDLNNRTVRSWGDIACHSAHWAKIAADNLNKILNWVPHVHYHTHCFQPFVADCRTPLIFLQRRRRDDVLNLLSFYQPYLSHFKDYPATDRRLGTFQRDENAEAFLSLHRALYTLASKMKCRTYPSLPVPHLLQGPVFHV